MTLSQVYIKVNGADLQNEIRDKLMKVQVDQHAHLPDMFTITVHDQQDRQSGKFPITDGDDFKIGGLVKIEADKYAGVTESSGKVTLIEGEITALEPSFAKSMIAELIIRGYDKSHRGYREKKSAAFLNIKDSDLASTIAGSSGLSPQTDATKIVYDHLYQNNQSDLAFLQQRAWRIGYECFVEDGKLYFRKPTVGSEVCEVTYGSDLMTFHPRMTMGEQVAETVVKGWDPAAKKPIVGQAKNGELYSQVGESKTGEKHASTFGTSKQVFVDHPVVSQAEADILAKARMNEISGSFIEATGSAFHKPEIRAGKTVKISGLGKRFSGKYLVTSATHRWTSAELTTDFTVSGTRTNTFIDRLTGQDPVDRWTGVVTALVTDTNDPEKWGRVKVKYPWLDDQLDSWWARIASVGAGGDNSGFIAVPEVNDEVLVAFEHGDFNRPFVLGGLWNGKDKPPGATTGAPSGEVPKVRSWRSRTGHYINMFDNADNKLEIVTAGGHSITLDDKNKKLQIISNGGMKLTVDDTSKKIQIDGGGDIVLNSEGNMNFSSTGDMKLSASNLTLDAKSNLKMSGLQLSAEGKTQAQFKGLTVSIQGSTLTEIKGALVKIN